MRKLLAIILILTEFGVSAQQTSCRCFNGIGSTDSDIPSLTIELNKKITLSVCGYEQEKISDDEVFISEFNVFNCITGERLVEYGAVKNCAVKRDEFGLKIIEMKFLPAGDNWRWEQVKIGLQQIYVKENKLIVSKQQPVLEKLNIDKTRAETFLGQLQKMKGIGNLDNPEEILGRLEILSLNGIVEAVTIIKDFENYFSFKADGAIAEQLKEAVKTIKWIKD